MRLSTVSRSYPVAGNGGVIERIFPLLSKAIGLNSTVVSGSPFTASVAFTFSGLAEVHGVEVEQANVEGDFPAAMLG